MVKRALEIPVGKCLVNILRESLATPDLPDLIYGTPAKRCASAQLVGSREIDVVLDSYSVPTAVG